MGPKLCELRRTPVPCTRVNKGKRKDRGDAGLVLFC
jgi:hypothetical protein